MSVLRIVLLCKGRGHDPTSFKPDRDDSQWWNRRDALVRCVAASLYSTPSTSIELILVFDEDYARFHMKLHAANAGNGTLGMPDKASVRSSPESTTSVPGKPFPNEQTVLKLLKESSKRPGELVLQDQGTSGIGTSALKSRSRLDSPSKSPPSSSLSTSSSFPALSCRLVLPRGKDGKERQSPSSKSAPSPTDSKRQVLEILQKQCSIEFLRSNGLNANATVVLRKTNKKALMTVWYKWNQSNTQQVITPPDNSLATVYAETLKPINDDIDRVLCGILHESSDAELPCFAEPLGENKKGNATEFSEAAPENLQVCLFLGAVRDMHTSENRLLARACSASKVPLMNVRIGPVAEFTSKILSVVAFHHANAVLGPALVRLSNRHKETPNNMDANHDHEKKKDNKPVVSGAASSDAYSQLRTIPVRPMKTHLVVFVPLDSNQVSSRLEHRSRPLWCLVRIVVCALWRSKLAGSSSTAASNRSTSTALDHTRCFETVLSCVFQDGVHLTLFQEELVSSLAQRHQAAPSEHQILAAICQKLNDQRNDASTDTVKVVFTKWCSEADRIVCLDRKVPTQEWLDRMYRTPVGNDDKDGNDDQTDDGSDGTPRVLLAVLDIQNDRTASQTQHNEDFEAVLADNGSALDRINLLPTLSIDWEAASVTVLQHLIYQRSLWSFLRRTKETAKQTVNEVSSGTKAKKKRKKEMKGAKKKRKKKKND